MFIKTLILKITHSVCLIVILQDKEKYFDDDEMWEKAQSMLKEAMDELGSRLLRSRR